jgi:hypothetical protein
MGPVATILRRRPTEASKCLVVDCRSVSRTEHVAVKPSRQPQISNGYGDMIQRPDARSSELAYGPLQPDYVNAGGKCKSDNLITDKEQHRYDSQQLTVN